MSDARKVNYLVCVNNEKYAEVALHYTCSIANRSDSSITILHVIEPADYQTLGAVADKMRQEKFAAAEKLLQNLSAKVQKWSNITPAVIVKEGLIEDQIIALANEDETIHMLIAGVAPETNVKSKIIPPIVSALGNKIHIPLMLVPGNLTEGQIDKLT